jgi:hypothetical protein
MDTNFKYRLLATFLGVILAFALARSAEWFKAWRDKKKKRTQLAKGLSRSLDRNLGILEQAKKEFAAQSIPTFPMDGGFLEHTRAQVYELISNPADGAAIEHARYELRHFDTKLEMLRDTAGQPYVELLHKELKKVSKAHVAPLEQALRDALAVAKKYETG